MKIYYKLFIISVYIYYYNYKTLIDIYKPFNYSFKKPILRLKIMRISLLLIVIISISWVSSIRNKIKQNDGNPFPGVASGPEIPEGPSEPVSPISGGDNSGAGAALVTRIIKSPYYWCWYPCYCWYSIFASLSSIRGVPICWCWYPCGCWWGKYFLGAARDEGISPASARASGGSALISDESIKPAPPSPPSSPPSSEPNF